MADGETGLLVDANESAGAVLGAPVEDLTGRHLGELCAGPVAGALVSFGRRLENGPWQIHEAVGLRHGSGKTVRTRVFASHQLVGNRRLVFLTLCDAPATCGPRDRVPAKPADDPPPNSFHTISPREREVLRLIGQGHTNEAIAAALGISKKTVESHRGRLMHKLGAHRSAHLVRLALAWGLTD